MVRGFRFLWPVLALLASGCAVERTARIQVMEDSIRHDEVPHELQVMQEVVDRDLVLLMFVELVDDLGLDARALRRIGGVHAEHREGVLHITVRSRDARLAATVADGLADMYVREMRQPPEDGELTDEAKQSLRHQLSLVETQLARTRAELDEFPPDDAQEWEEEDLARLREVREMVEGRVDRLENLCRVIQDRLDGVGPTRDPDPLPRILERAR